MCELIDVSIKGDLEKVKSLLNQGVDVNQKVDRYNTTSLMYASGEGHLEVVEELLKHNADVNYSDHIANTALIYASLEGHLEVVQKLLDHDANINHVDDTGSSSLMNASRKRHIKVVNELLNRGAMVDQADENGYTSLMMEVSTIKNQSTELLEILLATGADPNLKDHRGYSAIDRAEEHWRPEIKQLLSNYGDHA